MIVNSKRIVGNILADISSPGHCITQAMICVDDGLDTLRSTSGVLPVCRELLADSIKTLEAIRTLMVGNYYSMPLPCWHAWLIEMVWPLQRRIADSDAEYRAEVEARDRDIRENGHAVWR